MPPKLSRTVVMPEYFKKLSDYVIVGPKGLVPLTYVVEVNLSDRLVVEKMMRDPEFKARFQVSAVTPMNLEDLGKAKTGKVVVTLKEQV